MLWIDLSDLEDWTGEPTGIQRVEIEYTRRLLRDHGPTVRCCAFRPSSGVFHQLDGQHALFGPRSPAPTRATPTSTSTKSALRRLADSSGASTAIVKLRRGARRVLGGTSDAPSPKPHRHSSPHVRSAPLGPFADGDHLIILGANWLVAGHADAVVNAQRKYGLNVTHVLHDLIPSRHPQWAATGAATIVTPYLANILSVCTAVITVSEATRADLNHLVDLGTFTLRADCAITTVHHGCDTTTYGRGQHVSHARRPRDVSDEGPFILSVGTIEIRKNHIVLYQAYREAAARGIELPKLYIVGRSGWLAEATEHLIANDPAVRERITILPDVDDAGLNWLYDHCLFTLYPSVAEGWGLPVAESLSHDKVCLTTDHASIPEVGRSCADYLSAYDACAWLDAIVAYLDDEIRATREASIRSEYRRRTWDDAAVEVATLVGLPPTL